MRKAGALMVLVAMMLGGCAQAPTAGHDVPYRRQPAAAYLNFVANWEQSLSSAQYAYIRTAEEYDRIYHPAGVMGARLPHRPPESLHLDHDLVLVCRTTEEGDDGRFVLESLTEQGEELTVRYRFRGELDRESGFKTSLALEIPKKKYVRVRFIENGKEVRVLELSAEGWAFPPAGPRWQKMVRG